jgi:hypothetical protein
MALDPTDASIAATLVLRRRLRLFSDDEPWVTAILQT